MKIEFPVVSKGKRLVTRSRHIRAGKAINATCCDASRIIVEIEVKIRRIILHVGLTQVEPSSMQNNRGVTLPVWVVWWMLSPSLLDRPNLSIQEQPHTGRKTLVITK